MPALALVLPFDAPYPPIARIGAFMDQCSFESASLDAADIVALQGTAPRRTPVYLTSVPGRPVSSIIESAKRLRAAGFEPVPHLAVRSIGSITMLDDLLSNLSGQADVRRVLVVAGDRERAAGPFASALDLIESGRLQRYGIHEVGIAGYPEGHPRIPTQVLEQALFAKIEAAEQTGLKVHIVTQFCFDARLVLDWIARLRDRGIEHPVRIGMAGPARLSTILRYAARCGVRGSIQGLTRNAGLLKHLVGTTSPDGLIRPFAEAAAAGRHGMIAPHFFSFGGLAATGRWAAAVRAGQIVLDHTGGFRVAPR